MKTTKRALFSSLLALVLCFAMLLGTTYAWFTDSVTSGSNVIKAGTLDIVLEYWNGTEWVDAEGKVLEFQKANNADEEVLWEPGCTYEMPKFRVRNVGSLAAYVIIKLNGITGDEKLMEAIELKNKITNIPQSILDGSQGSMYKQWADATIDLMYGTPDGTVIFDWNLMGKGVVSPNSGHTDTSAEFTISGHMKEEAGNEYQGLSIEGISITVIASQVVYEYDSFGNDYDKDAPLPNLIASSNDLKAALANQVKNITIDGDIVTNEPFIVDYDVTINGSGKTISRASSFKGNVFEVDAKASLTLENVTVDGGAVWTSTFASNGALTNSGVTATGSLVNAGNNAAIVLEEGAILQNNDGANAVNLGTRIGATLTLNGGEIIYNRSGAGAVWGGGHITVNAGKINNNMSTGLAGAIRMVSKCNLTMNGGEICNNTAATNGGAIWGYDASTYNFNGGKMSNNTAGGAGGAMYPGTSSVINISGNFEMCDNVAGDGGAVRFTNHNTLKMSGGKISGNISKNSPTWNGFYGYDTYLEITGGVLADDVTIQGGLTPCVGGGEVTGTINFYIGTNHNTINLVKDFNTFKFRVNEAASNFAVFHFQPADGYTYTAGDEAKLVCLNEGYETYWDTTTNTFRLRAI